MNTRKSFFDTNACIKWTLVILATFDIRSKYITVKYVYNLLLIRTYMGRIVIAKNCMIVSNISDSSISRRTRRVIKSIDFVYWLKKINWNLVYLYGSYTFSRYDWMSLATHNFSIFIITTLCKLSIQKKFVCTEYIKI